MSGLFQTKAARHNDQYLRPPLQNVLPQYTNGIGPLTPKLVDAARDANHLRNPVAAAIDRIYPFHAKDSRPGRCSTRRGVDLFKSSPTLCDQCFCPLEAARRLAKIAQIIKYLFEGFRRKPQNVRLDGKHLTA